MPHIFVSYSRKDTAQVDALNNQVGRIFQLKIDRSDLVAAQRFDDQLKQMIAGAEVVLFVASANSVDSTFVLDELAHAIEHSIPILPYNLDGSNLPMGLGRTQYVTATQGIPVLLDQLGKVAPLARVHSGVPLDNKWVDKDTVTFEAVAEEVEGVVHSNYRPLSLIGLPFEYTRYHAVYLFGRKDDTLSVPPTVQLAFQLTNNYTEDPRNDTFASEIVRQVLRDEPDAKPFLFVVRAPLNKPFRYGSGQSYKYWLSVSSDDYKLEWEDTINAALRVVSRIGKPAQLQIFIQGPAVLLFRLGMNRRQLTQDGLIRLYHHEPDAPASQKYYCVFDS